MAKTEAEQELQQRRDDLINTLHDAADDTMTLRLINESEQRIHTYIREQAAARCDASQSYSGCLMQRHMELILESLDGIEEAEPMRYRHGMHFFASLWPQAKALATRVAMDTQARDAAVSTARNVVRDVLNALAMAQETSEEILEASLGRGDDDEEEQEGESDEESGNELN